MIFNQPFYIVILSRYCTVLYCTVLLPDAGAGLEDVEVLENVGHRHQPQGAEEPQPDPGPAKGVNKVSRIFQNIRRRPKHFLCLIESAYYKSAFTLNPQ